MKKQVKLLSIAILLFSLSSCNNSSVIKPQRQNIVDAVFANGIIFFDDEYIVTSNTEGFLKQTFKRENESVERNEPLFYISNDAQISAEDIAALNYKDAQSKLSENSPVLYQKKSQIALAAEQLRKDSTDYARNRRLYNMKAISKLDLENSQLQYESSKTNLTVQKESYAQAVDDLKLSSNSLKKQLDIQKITSQYNTLFSSTKGSVAEIYKQEGELVRRGEPIAKVVGGSVKIKLYIAEEDINNIKVGQEVVVALNTAPENKLKAKLTKIYPIFSTDDQSFVAEAEFDEMPQDIYLFSQTQLQVNIIIVQKSDALVIPTSYLTTENSVQVKGEPTPRTVEIGIHNINWAEVLAGLTEGDELVLPSKK